MNTPSSSASRWFLFVMLALAVLWFATLGTRRLLDPDEGRYAEISREMVVTGDWITPRLNGIKYFEKPPLQYWATAVAYELFGQSEYTARLWLGLTSFAGVVFAWFAAGRLFNAEAGRNSALIIASMLMYITLGHFDTLDIGLAFFLEVTVFSFLLAQHAPVKSTQERNWMLLAWCAAALAFLSKGLIALVLPSLTLLAYSIVTREFSAWKRLHIVKGLVLFLLIGAPWIILVSRDNPEFPRFFFWHEQFERFLEPIHSRDAPWWYFIPFLIAGALPWTSLCFSGLKRSWQMDRVADGFQHRRFLWLWSLVIMVFFSDSHSKLAPYIAPLFPALAVLCAEALPRIRQSSMRLHLWITAAVIATLATVLALVPDTIAGEHSIDMVNALKPPTAGAFFIVAVSAAIGGWWVVKRDLHRAVVIVACGSVLGFSVLIVGADALGTTRSAKILAEQLKPQLTADSTLYSINDYEQTLPFYLQRTMTLVGYEGELHFGLTQQPRLWVPDIDAFAQKWAQDTHPIAIIDPDRYKALREKLPMTIIAQQSNLLAVGKPDSNSSHH
ncbi:MAG TPA: glycosyltransferase family 39 protein [Steroidobacteraceae bacterium]|nr:glycosyltransferase family 39 protein [Steroidobacteraceae bacterium]